MIKEAYEIKFFELCKRHRVQKFVGKGAEEEV